MFGAWAMPHQPCCCFQSSPVVSLLPQKDGDDNAGGGGSIAVEHVQQLTITNSTFTRSWAIGSGSKGGGLLVDTAGRVQLSYNNFTNCTATEQGGGVHAANAGSIQVTNCSFLRNGHIPQPAVKGV